MKKIGISLYIIALCMVVSCAKQGFPSGGPSDKTPPVMVCATPASEQLSFHENSFFLEFDEYVTLKDAENNILISPPMEKKPEYSTKGHGVLVKIKDSLQPNTTYLFQFKEAIADFNEGNLLPSLEYVFSTGDVIDSMSLSGRVVDALTHQPKEDIALSVMLYESDEDSVVVKEKPTYITRCDKQGNFAFNYIRPGKYKLVAMDDGDKNLFLGANEAVAFSDSLLQAIFIPRPVPKDSAATDSAATEAKGKETVTPKDSIADTTPKHLFFLYTPKNEIQRLTGSEYKSRGRIMLTSQLPMVKPQVIASDSILWRLNGLGDTMTVWTVKEATDSIRLVVRDSLGLNDTLRLRYHQPKKTGASLASIAPAFMKTSCGTSLNYFDSLWLTFHNPVLKPVTDTLISVVKLSDSASFHCGVQLDSLGMRARIVFEPEQGEKYQFHIPRHLFSDLYGHKSDSMDFTIEVTSPENYGNLILHLQAMPAQPLLVQLLDEKDNLLSQRNIDNGIDNVRFEHLKGGKYKVRAIADENADGKWDVGDYWHHKQPEKVFYFPKTLDIRENWDFEENWNFK